MREINRRQALAWLATTLVGTQINGCGGGGGADADSVIPPSLPANSSPALRVADYLGSLYQPFDWSGPIRDPFRDVVEIFEPALAQPMTVAELSALDEMLRQRDIIMQIGGMGSAKPNPDPTLVNEQFKAYMDAIVADSGAAWRDAVTDRATEVALATPEGSRVYWQIGNEINAASYQSNIDLYLGRSSSSLLDIIPVYVEYFLAPTAQAMRQAASTTGKPVRLALGSIAGFSSGNARLFLDELLNYTVVGTYAPQLAGEQVNALVELITIHYLMNTGTPEQPEDWRDALIATRQKWMGVGAISGIWSTEEVGVQAADAGMGAGSALRILSRYLGWVSEQQDEARTTRWFFFGTSVGPVNQRIDDAMMNWRQWTGDNTLQLHSKLHSSSNTLETYVFMVRGASGWLLTVTALGEAAVSLSEVPVDLPDVGSSQAAVQAWLYATSGGARVSATLLATATGAQVRLDPPLNLLQPDTLLIWVNA
jgi:hypothetical protein